MVTDFALKVSPNPTGAIKELVFSFPEWMGYPGWKSRGKKRSSTR
jgi:hypothetical protein